MGGDEVFALELWDDGSCELLAELYAPLVKRVNVPDDALDKDLVFVHSDECAEGARSDLSGHDRVSGAVPAEDLVREELPEALLGEACLLELSAGLGLCLSLHECLCLCKEV